MFDTLTLLACLIGNDPGHSTQLTMKPPFLEKENKIICVQLSEIQKANLVSVMRNP